MLPIVPRKKAVRFPDLQANRDTIISNNSSLDLFDDNMAEDDEDDFVLPEKSQLEMNLPKFSFNPNDIKSPKESEGENSDLEDYHIDESGVGSYPASLSEDSSDEDIAPPNIFNGHPANDEINLKDDKVFTKPFRHGSLHSSTSRSSKTSKTSNPTSRQDSNNNGESKLKSILRKMTLSDQNYVPGYGQQNLPDQPSQSDSFMGKIFSLNSDSGGLGGGGLIPGASKNDRSPELDEEQRMGMNEDGIELKKLNVDELNETARNLISQHVTLDAPSTLSSAVNSDTEELLGDAEDHGLLNNNDGLYAYRDAQNDVSLQDDFMIDGDEYIAPPTKVHAGVLSSLLQLYQNPQMQPSESTLATSRYDDYDDSTLYSKGASNYESSFPKMKPSKFASKVLRKMKHKEKKGDINPDSSNTEIENDKDDDSSSPLDNDRNGNKLPSFKNAKPLAPKKESAKPSSKINRLKKRKKQQRLRITVHIGDILQKQNFIMKMCRALMLFGAPTHRLEEYMIMTSRVMEIDGQFIYLPGCMIISFGDAATRTSEVHLVRCNQGLNLSKLSDTHKIYKEVIHDLMGAEMASERLDELLKSRNLRPPWVCVLVYGLGSASVCPFAFSGGWVDVPIAFGVGLCVGYLQFFVSSMSNLYSSVFEVTASIVVSFIARAIGSVRNGDLFCFSAIVQGSLALILPGYIILCGSLELQSRNLVAGSVRMFYAIIYSLFLGFGITLGAALYGWIDKNAVSGEKAKTCQHPLNDKFRILFVPMFSACLGLINQARFIQLPVMLIIACAGYVGTYFAGKHFSEVTEFTACIGAFIVGVLGNFYSRIWKGMAVSAMLPAIFVQVPSGIASQSTLVSGIANADKITNSSSTDDTSPVNSLSFGATMVQVSIGISVGLFAAAIVVYPFGKKRTGLFSL